MKSLLRKTSSLLSKAFLSIAVIMISFALQRSNAFRSTSRNVLSVRKAFTFGRPSVALFSTSTPHLDVLNEQIKSKGDTIRELKASKGDEKAIKAAVDELLLLKKQLADAVGTPAEASVKAKKGGGNKGQQDLERDDNGRSGDQRAESIVITPRATDYSAWYSDVIAAADLIDQSPVRGCMVIKPWGMALWDALHKELDDRIKASGAQNCYFPLFIPKSFLAKEAQHVEGFAKECAVVTHHRLCMSPDGKDLIPDPEAELEEPLIVRPTSETVIWNMFGKWIKSHRDLPLKVNQWANVVRWEMRTRPFLRSAEFLWQEGHTAHATSSDAIATARESLEMYASVCEDMLALPCIKGRKSPSERFAGADDTFTIEALMQNGWALQSGTSHFLGQSFAKAFDVFFQTESGTRELVWATSWGVSTRLLGALVMTHSDDTGLVLPPRIAPVQVVVVPISKGSGEEHERLMAAVENVRRSLSATGLRVKVDARQDMRPGAKYFEWERKGVPLRLEMGPKDLAAGQVTAALRHTGQKRVLRADPSSLSSDVHQALEEVQQQLLLAARDRLAARTVRVSSYAEMKAGLAAGAGDISKGCFYLVPWKCDAANEATIKEDCKATVRCYPFAENEAPPAQGVKCFYSGQQATHYAIFARAF